MNAKQEKTLKLVSGESADRTEASLCEACDAKRQLEHVRFCLNAAMLAATLPTTKPTKKRGK